MLGGLLFLYKTKLADGVRCIVNASQSDVRKRLVNRSLDFLNRVSAVDWEGTHVILPPWYSDGNAPCEARPLLKSDLVDHPPVAGTVDPARWLPADAKHLLDDP